MALETKDIKKIAKLARIEIKEEQLDEYKDDLSTILELAEQLAEVNTDGVEPMTSTYDMVLRQREDVINDGNYPEKVLSNATEAEEGFFTVPKVVE
ncbi:MAG: Asp-tRNA(Asn)/Glu-tRNA(Gln) amidotransferase subunit GatC [Alphaproteobacteria bacterium]|jgi:aspartyl-tRNA(Asn)/glutamyl-tRNA(Gln) amidotransferase subunit C|nr:Asp-tRNA(Asn)/Glu-tRNA(Gln) amidotransferase subunit GatC [Alphaproteobacteria bacterium]MCV6599480.1 Asp-tRNA(Asn)/Glu-tRNA(Gln) amidotransferase subunit GatC [Alphaproteobacteria bacterium]